ncbi:MAG: hypothetical protein ABJE10_05665 [bacterium]
MSETNPSPDLSVLQNDYDIVGEVRGASGARTFTANRKDIDAKRRDDSSAVVISVFATPEGDEGNALSHLAADTKQLAAMTHRRLMPVIEGRWIGSDAFAVVSQRTTDPTLAQKLAVGETFTTPRVAAILREVNGLLEWAREHKIVHRGVTASGIFLESKTDRVRIAFGVSPIRRLKQVDDETEDARTIVRLAMAMLTGTEDATKYEGQSLAELRPDLPDQLRDATAELLDEKVAHGAADVSAYLTLVGMAGPLAAGETEAERIRDEILGEQVNEREKLAEQRATFEQTMERERATFERTIAEQREQFEEWKDEERKKLANEKAELRRIALAERESIVAKRAELERIVATQRQELERTAAEDRRHLDALRADLKRAGELEMERKREAALTEIADAESSLDSAEFATPLFVPPIIAPLEQYTFDDDNAVMHDDEDVVETTAEVAVPLESSPERANVAPVAAPRTRSKWLVPLGVAGLAAIVAASVVTLTRREPETVAPPILDTPVTSQSNLQTPAIVLPPPAVPLPTITDSASGSLAATDSLTRASALAPKPRPRRAVSDSIARRDSLSLGDSVSPSGASARARRDSLAKKDSVRPDTTPH